MTRIDLAHSAACERNRGPILEVLREAFGGCRDVLEIGSGTGQHAVYFAAAMPHLSWQPTDRATELAGLRARIELEGPRNVRAPMELDVGAPDWPAGAARGPCWDAAFSANTLHIMSAGLVERLFAGLGATLRPKSRLAIYGPFRYGGDFTSDSNARFDAALRSRDPSSGVRDFESIDGLAAAQGFVLVADHAMPAHNQLLLWKRG